MSRSIVVLLMLPFAAAGQLPSDEAGATAHLRSRQVQITTDAQGRAIRLMSTGKENLSAEEYALIGKLTALEQVGLNGAPLDDSEWGFLRSLPKLTTLSIWHGHGFATLKPFSGLGVESLTIGGCMGLRDKNRADPRKQRDVILTLTDLPRIKKGNWYHSPLTPDDAHLAHLAGSFPTLEDLKLDFAAPAGTRPGITPGGLAALQKLPLKVLSVENVDTFTAEHFQALARIKTLKTLLVDARRKAVDAGALAAFRAARPEVELVVADASSKGPPTAKKARS
jgi:hypothetical protein